MRLVSRKSNTAVLERPPQENTPQIPVDQKPNLDIYLRPGVAEDLILLNSWFQNPVVNRYSQMPKTWKDTLNWWKALGNETIISMAVLIDRDNPMSFYCGRTIGYIQWDKLDKEYPYLFIVVGDWSVSAMGVGNKLFELAGQQILQLKKCGNFYSVIHPESKIALCMAKKYEQLGIAQIEPMDSGWVKVSGCVS
jgi:hypothetical protein